MSETGTVLFGICIACTAGSFIYMLAPSGSMGKNVKTAVMMFVLFCICTSFTKAWKGVDVQVFSQSEDIYEQAEEIIRDNVKTAVTKTAEDILKENNIDFSHIEADICVSEDNEIYVRTIKIYSAKKSGLQETADEIFEKTGAVAEFCEAD